MHKFANLTGLTLLLIAVAIVVGGWSKPKPTGPTEIKFIVTAECPYDVYVDIIQYGTDAYLNTYAKYYATGRAPNSDIRLPYPSAYDVGFFKKNNLPLFKVIVWKRNQNGSRGVKCWERTWDAYEYERIVAESKRQSPTATVTYFPIFVSPVCCPGWVG